MRRAESSRAGSGWVGSSRAEPSRVGSGRVESSRVESSRVESSRVESSRAESSRAESSRAESSRVEPSRVESSRVESGRVESSQAVPYMHLDQSVDADEGAGVELVTPRWFLPLARSPLSPVSPFSGNTEAELGVGGVEVVRDDDTRDQQKRPALHGDVTEEEAEGAMTRARGGRGGGDDE